ncbi:MAG: TOBE domain-containing protein, partial [Bacteroidota bacterium]
DKVIILEQGQIVQIGTPREVYLNPKGINAARLFGPVNLIEIENSDRLAIRPERLKVEENGKYTGVVKKCKFFGHHYHLFIRTSLSEDELLIYHHRERNVGEQIFFDIEDS